MSNSVLIVEKDVALMAELRTSLTARGFQVAETTDGKGAPEQIRREKPDCVVLAVDLDAGQNGYILCKKLKSDDELKTAKVIIVGDPKGFAQHQKLKTRADEYLGKPFGAEALVELVGRLIGVPEVQELENLPVEDAFDPGSLLVEESGEIAIEDTPPPVASSTSDVALVDSVFDEQPAAIEELAPVEDEVSFSTDEAFDEPDPADKTVVGFVPPAPAPVRSFSSSASALNAPDTSELRAKVTELTGALEDARSRNDELDARIRELESELESRTTDLEAARASTGKADNKEVFALRDDRTKKEKEILRLKNELNQKEQEVVELHEKENQLEQQVAESEGELARRDAQIKTLQTKADQLSAERKKIDQQLMSAREEARAASAKLSTLQGDHDTLQQRAAELEGQMEGVRASHQESETGRQTAENELAEARGEIEALRSQLDERAKEADDARAQLEQAQIDLESARGQVTTQAISFADEISGLRQRLADAETEVSRAEEKASRAQGRLKGHQDQLDRLRTHLQQAMDTLGESPAEGDELEIDELAEA